MNRQFVLAELIGLAVASGALGQGFVGAQANFGGYYNRTSYSGGAGSGSVTSYGFGGGIGVGVASGYGGGYAGGYGVPYGYAGGCTPVFVPYSPFTRTYGNPCYPAVIAVPGSGCVVPVYPVACGQFIVR
jgi:hypothetical protein